MKNEKYGNYGKHYETRIATEPRRGMDGAMLSKITAFGKLRTRRAPDQSVFLLLRGIC